MSVVVSVVVSVGARGGGPSGTLRDYPELKKAVMEVLTGLIQKQNDAAADLVKTIIAMETNRINIHHPDFLGDRSIIDVMKRLRVR